MRPQFLRRSVALFAQQSVYVDASMLSPAELLYLPAFTASGATDSRAP